MALLEDDELYEGGKPNARWGDCGCSISPNDGIGCPRHSRYGISRLNDDLTSLRLQLSAAKARADRYKEALEKISNMPGWSTRAEAMDKIAKAALREEGEGK